MEQERDSESFWTTIPPVIQELFTQIGLDENTPRIALEAAAWGLQKNSHLMKQVPGIDVHEVHHHLGNWLQKLLDSELQ